MKKMICLILTCMIAMGTMSVSTGAAYEAFDSPDGNKDNITIAVVRASGSFNMSLPPNGKSEADKTFPLEAGETVNISAVYSPDDASVDFGLIDPNGIFHYFTVTDGSIDKTIRVSENGNYTLAVRNNSEKTVKVTGFVKY